MSERRKSKADLFMERVWAEHKALRLPPWTMITPLFTMGRECPSDEMYHKAEWDRAAAEFHAILKRNPDHYADVLPKRRMKK